MKKLNVLVPLAVPVITLFILFFLFKMSSNPFFNKITLKGCFLSLFKSLSEERTWTSLYFTLYISFKGLLGGLVASVFFGFIISCFPRSTKAFTFLLNGWRAIPLTLLIPFLAIFPVWYVVPLGLSTSNTFSRDPAILISIGTFQYLFLGILEGIDRRNIIRENYFIVTKKYSRLWYSKKILLYEILPSFLYSLRIAILFSVVLAIVLEQLITYPGIGYTISQLEGYMTADCMKMIALLTLVAYIGVFIDLLFKMIANYIIRWHKNQ